MGECSYRKFRFNPGYPLAQKIASLVKQLANPLSQQAGKWLVIPRRRESSQKKTPAKQVNFWVLSATRIVFLAGFPPARE
jgi:hypothetical protein